MLRGYDDFGAEKTFFRILLIPISSLKNCKIAGIGLPPCSVS